MAQNAKLEIQNTEGDQPQFMLLSSGTMKFLVEQSSIVAIEALSDVVCDMPTNNALGWLLYNNRKLPVYSFTDQLDFEHSISGAKPICVVLKHQEPCIAMMCTEAAAFKHNIHKRSQLPECMRASPSPIESICLCKIDDQITVDFVISAKSLLEYINSRRAESTDTFSENEKLA